MEHIVPNLQGWFADSFTGRPSTVHDGDASGWAEHFQQPAIVQLLKNDTSNT
jgi:hypothetical protein